MDTAKNAIKGKLWSFLFAGFSMEDTGRLPLVHPSLEPASRYERRGGYVHAVLICALVTVLALALRNLLDTANLIMLYLIAVVGVAVKLGRRPAILSSIIAVLAFDFFLVPPYYSLGVEDTEYLLTFAIMLIVSLLISTLTASLHYQVRISLYRERRTGALFDLSRDLSAALTCEQIVDIGVKHLNAMFQAEVTLLLPDGLGRLRKIAGQEDASGFLSSVSLDVAQATFDAGQPAEAGFGRDAGDSSAIRYFPLRAPMRIRGVLTILPEDMRQFSIPEQQRLLLTCAAQIALALERVHYVEVARESEVAMKAEKLRNSLLSAISHDVRTPLTAIVGMASMLSSNARLPEPARQELAEALQEESLRMNSLVTNLLDMAKLHSGGVRLNLHWQMLEEVVGSALRLMSRVLADRRIEVRIPPHLPLLEFDAVLIERVLCNLLSNVAKYTPPGSACEIAAEVCGDTVKVSLKDCGPGMPAGMEEAVFDKFARGVTESAGSGVGLGLSICRAIVEAHGGRIWAENCLEGGALLAFTLPAGSPPIAGELADKALADGMEDDT